MYLTHVTVLLVLYANYDINKAVDIFQTNHSFDFADATKRWGCWEVTLCVCGGDSTQWWRTETSFTLVHTSCRSDCRPPALLLRCSASLRLRQLTGGWMKCRGGAVLSAPRARNFPVSCECDNKVKRSSQRVNIFILWIAPCFRQELCWIMEWLDGMKSVRKRDAWKQWIGFSLEHLENARYWKVSQLLKWEWSICLLWNR